MRLIRVQLISKAGVGSRRGTRPGSPTHNRRSSPRAGRSTVRWRGERPHEEGGPSWIDAAGALASWTGGWGWTLTFVALECGCVSYAVAGRALFVEPPKRGHICGRDPFLCASWEPQERFCLLGFRDDCSHAVALPFIGATSKPIGPSLFHNPITHRLPTPPPALIRSRVLRRAALQMASANNFLARNSKTTPCKVA
jgi:hypothetical protein